MFLFHDAVTNILHAHVKSQVRYPQHGGTCLAPDFFVMTAEMLVTKVYNVSDVGQASSTPDLELPGRGTVLPKLQTVCAPTKGALCEYPGALLFSQLALVVSRMDSAASDKPSPGFCTMEETASVDTGEEFCAGTEALLLDRPWGLAAVVPGLC